MCFFLMDVHSLQMWKLLTVALFCYRYISLHSMCQTFPTNTVTNCVRWNKRGFPDYLFCSVTCMMTTSHVWIRVVKKYMLYCSSATEKHILSSCLSVHFSHSILVWISQHSLPHHSCIIDWPHPSRKPLNTEAGKLLFLRNFLKTFQFYWYWIQWNITEMIRGENPQKRPWDRLKLAS